MTSLSPTRSPGLSPLVPAMVLVEVLVAAGIMATVVVLFIGILVDADSDVVRARTQTQQRMIASNLLTEAQGHWPNTPVVGEFEGYPWTLTCSTVPQTQGRLQLVECEAAVQPRSSFQVRPAVTLKTAWAAPRDAISPP